MLNNLSSLELKIHNIQGVIRSIVNPTNQMSVRSNDFAIQKQLVATDLTSIIVDLISTAGYLLPSIKNNLLCNKFGSFSGLESESSLSNNVHAPFDKEGEDVKDLMKTLDDCDDEVNEIGDGGETDNLLKGSYEVLQLEKEEILAPHTHFCAICGKGFKRDANLRMHMRGHGDEYKTPAALAKPSKDPELTLIRRYSCPLVGCKRNKEHKNFQPLKTLLCVKNHYKRSHCEKNYLCSTCHAKKFSVLADLKTHEKHCGRDKWLCSCGTTFSRKDKLFGHVALFQGHAPALPADEGFGYEQLRNDIEAEFRNEGNGHDDIFSMSSLNDDLDAKLFENNRCYLSDLSFEPYDYGVSDEFMKAALGLKENSATSYPSELPDFGQNNKI